MANRTGDETGRGELPFGQLLFDDVFLLLGLGIVIPLVSYIIWGLLSITGTPPLPPSPLAASARPAAAPSVQAASPRPAGGAAFTLVAGQTQDNGGLNFNGASHGHPALTVPVGARVQLTLVNQGTMPHSLQVIPFTATPPVTALPHPAFPGAETTTPRDGTAPGQSAVAVFTATTPGRYLLICGVPGHALAGMYGILDVAGSPSATPRMSVR